MPLNMQQVINGPLGLATGMGIAKLLPAKYGYQLGKSVAKRLAMRTSMPMVQAVYANQRQIHGQAVGEEELETLVRRTFEHTARCLYDVYHNYGNQEAFKRLIHFGPRAQEIIARKEREDRGLVIVAPHLSNFEIVLQAVGILGLRGLTLGFARPGKGYQIQNRLRRETGLDLAPASLESIRRGVKLLREGGAVLTGVDRPVVNPSLWPKFFDRPASLPLHYVTLALKASVPIVVSGVIMNADGIYEVYASEPIEVVRSDNRRTELLQNAENILGVVASYIRRAPQQWSMFYPVWP